MTCAPRINGHAPARAVLLPRATTNDCITFHHTNLVPRVYVQDDFQVRTPTDIMGQHIHLVKFDVTSSDGAGNGWNYEDGTFAPEEVIERIKAIRKQNNCTATHGDTRDGTFACPVSDRSAHPVLRTTARRADDHPALVRRRDAQTTPA